LGRLRPVHGNGPDQPQRAQLNRNPLNADSAPASLSRSRQAALRSSEPERGILNRIFIPGGPEIEDRPVQHMSM
jgi:hypothetical protein